MRLFSVIGENDCKVIPENKTKCNQNSFCKGWSERVSCRGKEIPGRNRVQGVEVKRHEGRVHTVTGSTDGNGMLGSQASGAQ